MFICAIKSLYVCTLTHSPIHLQSSTTAVGTVTYGKKKENIPRPSKKTIDKETYIGLIAFENRGKYL